MDERGHDNERLGGRRLAPGRTPSSRTSSTSPLRQSFDTRDVFESQSQNNEDGAENPRSETSRDVPDESVARRASHPRVRFSVDVERAGEPPLSDRRPGSRGLTVDTSMANSHLHPRSASSSPPTSRSTSPHSPNRAVSPLSPQSAASTGSRRRNRGYSLRRTLFAKNIQNQNEEDEEEEDDEVIELETSRPSQEHRASVTETSTEKPAEATESTTTVSCHPKEDEITIFSDPSDPKTSTTSFRSITYDRWLRRKATRALFASRVKGALEAVRKTVLRIKDIPPTKDGRHVDLDFKRSEVLIDERTGNHYIPNTIRSSRYSLWSFFPRQFIAQFSKVANFYFLVVSILQMIPGLSTTGTFTTFIPLMIFVGISMGKEGFDDLRRYRLDKEENNREAYVLRHGEGYLPESDGGFKASSDAAWTLVKWKDIKVGDVIKLERDQPAPADIILLHAEEANGVAYIETMALDGETNLKSKSPCQPLAKACSTVEGIGRNTIHFVVEDPNLDLYKFDGNVAIDSDEKLPLTNNEIIYRGSVLRNTAKATGVVVYTGEECKIRMNANKNPRIKAPQLQVMVNRVVMVIVAFVVILAVICTIAYSFWQKSTESKAFYLELAKVSYGPIFTSFLIMYNTMIPISLYVSLEIVKVCQMLLLNDIDMYDEESDTPLEARTSTINEELGQVSYIFSDKTGTLTNNSMRFRRMSVAGTAWFHDSDLREEAARKGDKGKLVHKKRKSKKEGLRKSSVGEARVSRVSRVSRKSNVSTIHQRDSAASPARQPEKQYKPHRGGLTAEMIEYIQQKPHTVFAKKARFFILALALCHTCLPERGEDDEISFQSASPDELALVLAAQELGYLVYDRQPRTLTIRTFPNGPDSEAVDETYQILDVIEFSSARKRMSIVVRMPDGRICVLCKGADSTIMKLLKRSELAAEKVADIERRASKRKNMEAMEIIRRNSEHHPRKDSGLRTSMNITRPSFGGRRSSVSGKHLSLRDSIDVWLRDRETDGGLTAARDEEREYYSPRPSAQVGGGRPSGVSEARTSFQTEDSEDVDLVDEALVVNEAAVYERCFQHLNDFASEGLRTLLYGYRFLDDAEYEAWKAEYHEATTSLVDRQEKIEQVGEKIETQLDLVGATAIEDKLQKGVPEAIDKLRRANIKLWMLTGDKRETAINIGHSCRLLKDYSTTIVLDHTNGEVEQLITATTASIKNRTIAHSVVVVDGQTLSMIESNKLLEERFFGLAILADSVICCRASPKQKAYLVKAIRKRVKKSITLAIGDGANDIAMIQEAHVGIGITGKEGMQAARISDYSIAQFRFLLKLLLVHGRWNYIRVCKYTLGTFWKETLFYLTQALYQRWNGYTGTSLYESWSLSMFNTLFTSLPVIFLGIFEKDLAASTLLAVPELYTKGQLRQGFNVRIYLGWAFMATCEAMIVFFTMYSLFGSAMFTSDNTIFPMGFLTFSACVVVISSKLQCLEIRNKSLMAVISCVLSIGGWFLWNIILSCRYSGDMAYDLRDNFLTRIGRSLLWWTTLLVAVSTVLLFETAVSTLRAMFFPTDVDLFQQYEQDREIRKRFEEAAADELQQGWDRGTKKSSMDLDGDRLIEEAREQHVQELLDRPRVMDPVSKSPGDVELGEVEPSREQREDTGGRRRSLDVHELLSRGFGSIRKGQELK